MFYHSNRVEDIQLLYEDVLCIVVTVNCPCQSATYINVSCPVLSECFSICRLIIYDQCHSYAMNKQGACICIMYTVQSFNDDSYHHHIWYDHQSHGAVVHCVHDWGS